MDNQESGPIDEAPSILDRIEGTLTEESEPVEPTEPEEQASAEPAAPEADVVEDDEEESESAESTESEAEAEVESDPQMFKVPGDDGTEIEVSAEELRKGFMMQKDYTRKTMELAEQRAEFNETSQQQLQEFVGKLEALDSLLQTQEASVNWDELRELDPSEYMRQTELRDQRQKALEKGREEMAERHTAHLQQMRAQEQEKLMQVIPEWLDPKAAEAGAAAVRSEMTDMGFNEQEINSIFDHRMIRMAHENATMRAELKKIKETASEVREKVKEAAPLTKPRTTAKSDPDASRAKKLRQQMRKGTRGAVAAYLEDLL